MLLKGKIILTSVISSLALVSISGFIGYKIGLINNVEYKNRNKRLLRIIGFNRLDTSDDWIDYRRGYSYQGEFRKRKDELLLIVIMRSLKQLIVNLKNNKKHQLK
ncbi:hypothetical protein MFERI15568_00283 [Mycoplasma feriruminatoris]|uniref:hypothetical protein n=1 Tax=Mycoplasma feriruminatoris TaxID=1179777 RepID=UPI00241EBA0F|nr:hypothetical protein [Mycoplasma feriruminatoris]WFQ95859.1 hypothetical protein MFERI15568_00283 [Mycoplasma feriruminatoris]